MLGAPADRSGLGGRSDALTATHPRRFVRPLPCSANWHSSTCRSGR